MRTVTACLLLLLSGCPAVVTTPPATEPPPSGNIAAQVLPGRWRVVGEPIVYTFDAAGLPASITNVDDPQDWRTNLQFGQDQRLIAPFGSLNATFYPGEPSIDAATGEARFSAVAVGSNIELLALPVPGEGHANYEFTGHYDAATGQLSGSNKFEVYYGQLMIYSDVVDKYVLQKESADGATAQE
jgi:hypothetical protein